jgi:WD40 repeat protein
VPDRLWSLPEAASGSLLASPDGGALVRLRPDGEVSVWDVATGARRLAFRAPARRWDWLLAASRGALRVVVGSFQPGGGVAVCDLAAGRVLLDRAGARAWDASKVCFAPDGELLALIADGRTLVLSLADGRATPLYEDTPGPGPRGAQTMVLSPDERLLAVNVWDGGEALLLFELPSGRLLARVADPYRALAFSPDGLLFCQGTGARTDGEPLAFWDMRTWTPVRRLVCPVRPPPGASLFRQPRFTPDGRAWLDLWGDRALASDAVTNRRLGALSWDASAFAFAALRPDGSLLTVARADGAVRVWPAELLLGAPP